MVALLPLQNVFAGNETESRQFPDALIALSTAKNLATTALLVDKTARKLQIYKFDSDLPQLILETPTDLGKRGGDKEKSNDHRTPTGLYFLTGKKSPPQIPFDLYGQLAFETDYPNFFDKLAGKTGSGIWLHAVPDTVPLTRGSRGCVVVRNNMIKEIEKYVQPGQTPILILDQIQNLTEPAYRDLKKNFMGALEEWRKAWEAQDIETYMKFYASGFQSNGMDVKKWKKYKLNLKSLYSNVKVEISEPMIVRNHDQVLIRFMQKYSASQHADFGEKTLVARWAPDGGLQILSENWVGRESSPEVLSGSVSGAEKNQQSLQSAEASP